MYLSFSQKKRYASLLPFVTNVNIGNSKIFLGNLFATFELAFLSLFLPLATQPRLILFLSWKDRSKFH